MRPPFLSLKDIDFNPGLAARVPAYLAYYHLAIPVAEEDEQITLWMAYPENPKVISLFVELLGQAVFPVRGSQDEMRYYWDSSHFKEVVGNHVLDRLLQTGDKRWSAKDDFGIELGPDNIEDVIARLRSVQQDYRSRHTDEIAELNSWVADFEQKFLAQDMH